MPQPQDTNQISWLVMPMQRKITGPAGGDREFAQSGFDATAYLRMVCKDSECVQDGRLHPRSRIGHNLQQKRVDPVEVFEGGSGKYYFRHDTFRGRVAGLPAILASR